MIVRNSSEEIGEHNYTHWSGGRPTTPGTHGILLVPQSLFDGWDAYCSCGEWRAFISFYEIDSRDELLSALRKAHGEHAAMAAEVGKG